MMRKYLKRSSVSDVFINRNFALLWTGETVSVLGDAAFDAALALWIATGIARGQIWAPLALSGVYLAAALPGLLIGPIAGVFVDRWDKRSTMLAMDVLRALLIIVLMFVTRLLPLPFVAHYTLPVTVQLAVIYTVVALVSVCGQLFGPSQVAMIGDIVPEERRTQATAQSNATANLGWVIGPIIASILFIRLGLVWAVLVNALSFGVSLQMLLLIRTPRSAGSVAPGEKANFLREFVAGLRFSLGNRVVKTLIVSGVLFMFGVGALNTLYLFFLIENLHAPAELYGFFVAVPATGAMLGGVFMSRYARRIGEARTLWLSLILWGGVIILLARQGDFWPAAVLLFFSGLFLSGISAVTVPLLLHVTPRELVGRAFAVMGPCVTMASMLSMLLAGYIGSTAFHQFHALLLGARFGFVDTIYTITGLLSCSAGVYTLIVLRNMRCSVADSSPVDEVDELEEVYSGNNA